MSGVSVNYAVARIRYYEKKLLTKQTYTQMAEAKNAEESFRILSEAGYGEQANVRDFEIVLTEELNKTYELIKSLAPQQRFVDIFLVKNDIHNLKTLIKAEVSGKDGSAYLINSGTIPLDKLKEAVEKRKFSELPKAMGEAVNEAYDIYAKTQNGQTIDIVLDKAAFTLMSLYAKESGIKFVVEYVKRVADLTNLKSFIRVRNMGKPFEAFENVFVTGGALDKEKFKAAFGGDNPALSFKYTDYGAICEEGMNKGFTTFEKLCDNYLMEFAKSGKIYALSAEPLVAYLYAKESEVKTARIIMSGKINSIDADIIKERLREAYV